LRAAPLLLTLALVCAAGCALRPALAQPGRAGSACDSTIASPASGYGADGPYTVRSETLDNPAFARKPVQVFLPSDARERRPVIFFAHGFGPNYVEAYRDLIRHVASRGYILVYSTYPALGADHEQRYAALWRGFEAAVAAYGDRMDLSRVGFLGHSYGGGAVPALAWRGLVQNGWGAHGAFMMLLAPWYSYQLDTARLQQLPQRTLALFQVYEDDAVNDPRMAIDLYLNSTLPGRYFLQVRSSSIDGCRIVADHMTPARNASLRQKQYAVFRPFDALAEAAFQGSDAARAELRQPGSQAADYHPLQADSAPQPAKPQGAYRWPWSQALNPRATAAPAARPSG
jgi:pimeloyl-ACP methyl ester carboxylesterase